MCKTLFDKVKYLCKIIITEFINKEIHENIGGIVWQQLKEIAEIVGVSSSAVSRVLNYDEGISVSDETREAIFATAEKIGYKKRVIYPKIENVALLYFVDHEDELEDVFYHGVKDEIIKQAKR